MVLAVIAAYRSMKMTKNAMTLCRVDSFRGLGLKRSVRTKRPKNIVILRAPPLALVVVICTVSLIECGLTSKHRTPNGEGLTPFGCRSHVVIEGGRAPQM